MKKKNDSLMAVALVGLTTANVPAATTFFESGDIDGTSVNSTTFCRVEGLLDENNDDFTFTNLTPGIALELNFSVLTVSDPDVRMTIRASNSSGNTLDFTFGVDMNFPVSLGPFTVPMDGIVEVSLSDSNGFIAELGESGTYAVTIVPEAGTTALTGLAGLVALNRRRRKKS